MSNIKDKDRLAASKMAILSMTDELSSFFLGDDQTDVEFTYIGKDGWSISKTVPCLAKSMVKIEGDFIDITELAAALTAYYTKLEVNDIVSTIMGEFDNYYTDAETDTIVSNIMLNFGNYYTKTEINDLLANLGGSSSTFPTKTQLYASMDPDHTKFKTSGFIAGKLDSNITTPIDGRPGLSLLSEYSVRTYNWANQLALGTPNALNKIASVVNVNGAYIYLINEYDPVRVELPPVGDDIVVVDDPSSLVAAVPKGKFIIPNLQVFNTENLAPALLTMVDLPVGTDLTTLTKLSVQKCLFPSRQDLVFLESWTEDVTEKDFVYPNGNVRYLGSDVAGLVGIADGTFAGADTYSLFGNWEAPSTAIGKGYVWSALTEEEQLLFANSGRNNIYTHEGSVYQIRYRLRTVQGYDSNWTLPPTPSATEVMYQDKAYVMPKGKLTSIASDINEAFGVEDGFFMNAGTNNPDINFEFANEGTFGLFQIPNAGGHGSPSADYGVNNEVYMIPIALVQRRNRGVYDPKINPHGSCATFDDAGGTKDWFTRSKSEYIHTLYDTFTPGVIALLDMADGSTYYSYTEVLAGTAPSTVEFTGSVYSGTTPREDGLYFDLIDNKDVMDLRYTTDKQSYSDILANNSDNVLGNKIRGREVGTKIHLTEKLVDGGIPLQVVDRSNNIDYRYGGSSTMVDGDGVYYRVSNKWVYGTPRLAFYRSYDNHNWEYIKVLPQTGLGLLDGIHSPSMFKVDVGGVIKIRLYALVQNSTTDQYDLISVTGDTIDDLNVGSQPGDYKVLTSFTSIDYISFSYDALTDEIIGTFSDHGNVGSGLGFLTGTDIASDNPIFDFRRGFTLPPESHTGYSASLREPSIIKIGNALGRVTFIGSDGTNDTLYTFSVEFGLQRVYDILPLLTLGHEGDPDATALSTNGITGGTNDSAHMFKIGYLGYNGDTITSMYGGFDPETLDIPVAPDSLYDAISVPTKSKSIALVRDGYAYNAEATVSDSFSASDAFGVSKTVLINALSAYIDLHHNYYVLCMDGANNNGVTGHLYSYNGKHLKALAVHGTSGSVNDNNGRLDLSDTSVFTDLGYAPNLYTLKPFKLRSPFFPGDMNQSRYDENLYINRRISDVSDSQVPLEVPISDNTFKRFKLSRAIKDIYAVYVFSSGGGGSLYAKVGGNYPTAPRTYVIKERTNEIYISITDNSLAGDAYSVYVVYNTYANLESIDLLAGGEDGFKVIAVGKGVITNSFDIDNGKAIATNLTGIAPGITNNTANTSTSGEVAVLAVNKLTDSPVNIKLTHAEIDMDEDSSNGVKLIPAIIEKDGVKSLVYFYKGIRRDNGKLIHKPTGYNSAIGFYGGPTVYKYGAILEATADNTTLLSDIYGVSVLEMNGVYHMIYTENSTGVYRPKYATSTNGIVWTHKEIILELGISGEADSKGILDVNLVNIDGNIYLYYTALDDAGDTSIIAAVTSDFSLWTKHGVVLTKDSAGGTMKDGVVGAPSVYKKNNTTYVMYYTGRYHNRPAISYATATQPLGVFSKTNKKLVSRSSGKFDQNGCVSASVITNHTKFGQLVYYTGKGVGDKLSIGLATSNNITSVSKRGLIISNDEVSGLGGYGVRLGTAMLVDGVYKYWYIVTDRNTLTTRIGFATTEFLNIDDGARWGDGNTLLTADSPTTVDANGKTVVAGTKIIPIYFK